MQFLSEIDVQTNGSKTIIKKVQFTHLFFSTFPYAEKYS